MSDRPTLVHTSRPARKPFRQTVAQALTLLSLSALGYCWLLIVKLYFFLQHDPSGPTGEYEGNVFLFLLSAAAATAAFALLAMAFHSTIRSRVLLILSVVTILVVIGI